MLKHKRLKYIIIPTLAIPAKEKNQHYLFPLSNLSCFSMTSFYKLLRKVQQEYLKGTSSPCLFVCVMYMLCLRLCVCV